MSTKDGVLLIDRLNVNALCVLYPKLRSEFNRLNAFDLVPFEFKAVYEAFFSLTKSEFTWMGHGFMIKKASKEVLACLIPDESIIVIHSSATYMADGKHIGLEYTNKKTRDYIMLNQRYYKTIQIDYLDLCPVGITLPEKCYWMRIKLRKRYMMFLLHQALFMELPNFKEILFSWIHSVELLTKLEVGFQELFILNLLPDQVGLEFLEMPNRNLSLQSQIIAESLGMSIQLYLEEVKKAPSIVHYTDLINIGTTFSKNFDTITQYVVNCSSEWRTGWNSFPTNFIDAATNTYISFNGNNRDKTEMEKLILWKIHGFNSKMYNWIRILHFDFVHLEHEFNWKPPLSLYQLKNIIPDGQFESLIDMNNGFIISNKYGRQFHNLN
jgi:hypothetical protein